VKRFVTQVLDDKPTGEHLLADPNQMERLRREDVGAPKPVVDEILRRVRRFAVNPDWMVRMKARQRCSYFFVGGTGCGKSFHLKLIATEWHDLVEEITGTRASRVVMLDASHFWNSLFGSTEQRIAAWADQIQAVGSQPLLDREGREVRIPLCIILEEAEALLRNRGEDAGGSSHLFDRPLALLLQKTESLETAINAPIFWLMTSNKPSLLDPAAQRRFGTRQVTFGPLRLAEARSVLATKVPEEMPIYGSQNGSGGRSALINTVLGYLYGPEPRQEIAEVHLVNSQRRKLHRRDLVTPAVLEEAVSSAVDRCLDRSEKAGELLGLDADDVVRFLARHFVNLARSLRPHNVADHCPDWFREEPEHVTNVVPLIQRSRPRALLLD
jgi:SpoVK/Ycf46/Vps4 family AAA+-type ATPase